MRVCLHGDSRATAGNVLCSWACVRCSKGNNVIALHPPVTQGSKRHYGCLKQHRTNPHGGGYKEFVEKVTGTSRSSKRRRKINVEYL